MNLQNVEIKARCNEPERIRSILENQNADFIGLDRQVDSYFNVKEGRLKLREGTIENNLIYYRRPDSKEPKDSDIELIPMPDKMSADMKNLLKKSLGIWITVEKEREIYFIDNVKFHIDEVKQLGSFVEIEAIDKDGSKDMGELYKQCLYYMDLLKIEDSALVDVSYSDMLAEVK